MSIQRADAPAAPSSLRVLPSGREVTPKHRERPRNGTRATLYRRHGKRALDLGATSLLIVALAPVMAFEWLVLRVTLGKGVILVQERIGLDGEPFGMFKFRTMRQSRRGAHRPFHGPDRRATHKSDNDPRHTPIGRVARSASLDELPQLFNVLRGDMSLVGPRPELATVVDRYDLAEHPRHTVRPGVTGLWQVTSRQQGVLLHESVDDDLSYLDDITLRGDLAILWRTVGVLAHRGGR